MNKFIIPYFLIIIQPTPLPFVSPSRVVYLGKWSRLFGLLGTHFFGGGLGKRLWVSKDKWGGGGGWVRDHGSLKTSSGAGCRDK